MTSKDWRWTAARSCPLTGSQVKALWLVASDAHLLDSDWAKTTAARTNRRLARMTRIVGEPMRDALGTLLDAATPVRELCRIKELAKSLIRQAPNRQCRNDATLLYHLAVAAAFVHHDTAISARPSRKQLPLYDMFADTWDGHPIGLLFREAAARARNARC